MANFVKGDIVVIPFPFSDLSSSKRRPALVLADLSGDDILLCQITSQPSIENTSISLEVADFKDGGLPVSSFVRPTRIFTADKGLIIRKAGTVSNNLINKVINNIITVLKK
jgi:mRNA interferase MazF